MPPVNALNDLDIAEAYPANHVATLPAIYMAADYKWELDGHWSLLRIGEVAPELDAAFPEAQRFGMLTASNPGHHMRSDEANRAADHALQRELDRRGLSYRPSIAIAHNRAWKAYNWLVIGPEQTDFDSLGRSFGQIGTLLWSRGEPVRLRMRADRPESLPDHAFIDWIGDPAAAEPALIGENLAFTA
jgi:Protein of unknown function (DUF3293)